MENKTNPILKILKDNCKNRNFTAQSLLYNCKNTNKMKQKIINK